MRAWIFQDGKQKQKRGTKAPWSIGWYEPDGRKRQKRIGSKSMAQKFARKLEGEIAAGVYLGESRKSWAEFRREYCERILPRYPIKSRLSYETVLSHFERIINPQKVGAITTAVIDKYVSIRRKERGRKPGTCLSAATLNHDLKHLKTIIRVAHEWGYLPAIPKFRFERELDKIGAVVSPEDFQQLYGACEAAGRPGGLAYSPAEWWRALLTFAITSGWRIDEILSFRRDDLNLKTGEVITRATDNKGKTDDVDYLPAITIDHLKRIADFKPVVFWWPHHRRTLSFSGSKRPLTSI